MRPAYSAGKPTGTALLAPIRRWYWPEIPQNEGVQRCTLLRYNDLPLATVQRTLRRHWSPSGQTRSSHLNYFEQVQEVLDARSGRGQRDRVHHHFLKGLLFCDRCHQRERPSRLIFAEVTGRGGIKYQYFVCRGREDNLCNLPHLRVELVERAIIDHYQTLSLPRDFIAELHLLDETQVDETASVKERHAAMQRQLKRLDQQENRLVTALADDTMPKGKIKAKLRDIAVQRARIDVGLTNTAA
ncbi:zinc ribbon domain-containing protein [Nocardia brasiliensis]|uniref:zinc ribbon domain-containing protein n=1 Tax=Nocardia brasiliensis TaxID=37326 RepID=UPI003D89F582